MARPMTLPRRLLDYLVIWMLLSNITVVHTWHPELEETTAEGNHQNLQREGGEHNNNNNGIISEYEQHHHRSRRFASCVPALSSINVTQSRQPAHHRTPSSSDSPPSDSSPTTAPYVGRRFVHSVGEYAWMKHDVLGHVFVVDNPAQTVAILEPGGGTESGGGGCGNQTRATVSDTIAGDHCLLAINGGLFNTRNGACLGNVVSDGQLVQSTEGILNAHFGITRDDELFFGYIAADTDLAAEFKQLVGGVIWLVRNGTNYVQEALDTECADTQETGNLERFVNVESARTAVGQDKDGRLMLIHVDGQTDVRGINLLQLADLLIEMGAVDAINLDGGGSSTFLQENIIINHPSDTCRNKNKHKHKGAEGGGEKDFTYRCARRVSTVLCVRPYPCAPAADCSGHGTCDPAAAQCRCRGNWRGDACNELYCGLHNCSGNGECTEAGCECEAGWQGEECELACVSGMYGPGCSMHCDCQHGGVCRPDDGGCHCAPGYQGFHCEHECDHGFYGKNCAQLCYCDHGCGCHHVSGSCDLQATQMWHVGQCVADYVITERHLVVEQPEQVRLWVVSMVVVCVVACASVLLNISLLCLRFSHTLGGNSSSSSNGGPVYTALPWRQRRPSSKPRHQHPQVYKAPRLLSSSSMSSHDESEIELMEMSDLKNRMLPSSPAANDISPAANNVSPAVNGKDSSGDNQNLPLTNLFEDLNGNP